MERFDTTALYDFDARFEKIHAGHGRRRRPGSGRDLWPVPLLLAVVALTDVFTSLATPLLLEVCEGFLVFLCETGGKRQSLTHRGEAFRLRELRQRRPQIGWGSRIVSGFRA